MTVNTSHAVRAQRVEPPDSLDDFPTPPWAARALCEHLPIGDKLPGSEVAWDPACNRGALVHGLKYGFGQVHASDVLDYRNLPDIRVRDFLWPDSADGLGDVDWIITNPPFRLAEDFIERALALSKVGCAMLLRTGFLHGGARYERLFRNRPPTLVLHFAERVVMLRGRLVQTGATDWIATHKARLVDPEAPLKKATTATDYSWFIWAHDRSPLPPSWVPPGTRVRLESEGDYDLWPVEEIAA